MRPEHTYPRKLAGRRRRYTFVERDTRRMHAHAAKYLTEQVARSLAGDKRP